jgi:flagellar hook assembly protein FlgD
MFSIAPNPTTGAISITAPNGTHTLMVLDVQGAVVFQQALDASSMVWDGRSMHGAMVAPGIYTVVFEGASRTTSASLVVIR